MEEVYASHEKRNLLGFEVKLEGHARDRRIVSMTFPDGRRWIAERNMSSPLTVSMHAAAAIIS